MMCVGGSGNDMMSEIDLKKTPQNKNKRQIQQYCNILNSC